MNKSAILTKLTTSMLLALLVIVSCTSSKNTKNEAITVETANTVDNGLVKTLYFHGDRRCATCIAVEEVARETLSSSFEKPVSFESINREDEKNKTLIETYQISGQTLLIIKGDKIINLTNDAFLNARNNPEKLKAKIIAAINSLN